MTAGYDHLHMANNHTKFQQNPFNGFWGVASTKKWRRDGRMDAQTDADYYQVPPSRCGGGQKNQNGRTDGQTWLLLGISISMWILFYDLIPSKYMNFLPIQTCGRFLFTLTKSTQENICTKLLYGHRQYLSVEIHHKFQ